MDSSKTTTIDSPFRSVSTSLYSIGSVIWEIVKLSKTTPESILLE